MISIVKYYFPKACGVVATADHGRRPTREIFKHTPRGFRAVRVLRLPEELRPQVLYILPTPGLGVGAFWAVKW